MEQKYIQEAEKIASVFDGFTDGIRLIMLTHRSKEGGTNKDRKQIKKISTNRTEFIEILAEFLRLKDKENLPHRIYSSLNRRNIDKAIRCFKQLQLDNDYLSGEDKGNFYLDIKNRWVSSLMQTKCRDEKNFLIDIDEGESVENCEKKLINITRNFFKYPTKNGWHIVSQPFNPQLLQGYEIKKDGLLLLKF